jgi:hypothetical protein
MMRFVPQYILYSRKHHAIYEKLQRMQRILGREQEFQGLR